MDCHSKRDWTKSSGPIIPGTEGQGGDRFGEEMGLPGTLYSKNITPAGLGSWTDGEILRALTAGVNKDNKALFPLMPYLAYRNFSREDLYSIIAYLRTLKPIKNEVPESSINFPVNLIIKTLPEDYTLVNPEPDKNNPKEYGKYLVTAASCIECHTKSEGGEMVKGMEFAGGGSFEAPWGTITSANITPDKETGIGNWTKEIFIARFKAYNSDEIKNMKMSGHEFNSIMPWSLYAGMTEEDLGAIYDYLRTQKPVRNLINRYSPPGVKTASN
jgi:mono/diheme cytochrome c family protein